MKAQPLDLSSSATVGANFFHLAAGLVVSILVILLLAFVAKKMRLMNVGMSSMVNIKGATSISLKEKLLVVEAGGQWLLLGVTPNQITTLHRFEEIPEEFIKNKQASFDDVRKFLSKKKLAKDE